MRTRESRKKKWTIRDARWIVRRVLVFLAASCFTAFYELLGMIIRQGRSNVVAHLCHVDDSCERFAAGGEGNCGCVGVLCCEMI